MRAAIDLVTAAEDARALAELNLQLEAMPAAQRIEWGLENLSGSHAVSSSFGSYSAVLLHLLTSQVPDLPVILIDTGYLFPETYRLADQLGERLHLNLKVYRPQIGVAWMEARHGRLWEQGLDGIQRYNRMRKVEPMRRALDELNVRTWFAGLRRSQSPERRQRQVLELANGRWKLHPLIDWRDRDLWRYLQAHDLPQHPLFEQGYVSIGDVHTTRPLTAANDDPAATRFFGLTRECGLHVEI